MLNAEFMHLFIEKYSTEIEMLVADLQLQDVNLCFSEAKPEGAKTNPSIVSGGWIEEEPERCYVMSFNWDSIVDSRRDLHHGLVILAHSLRRIWQFETGMLKDGLWNGPIGMPGKQSSEEIADHDAIHYAYDAVQRLFDLYSDEEVQALKRAGSCLCKSCRKKILRRLPRRVRTYSSVLQ